MISKIDNSSPSIAQDIWAVFQVSYAVEADLLNVSDFPPLKRSITDFLKSKTDFYAYFQNEKLTAVTEIKSKNDNTHIQSLAVAPYYFRQGIGQKLVSFVLEAYNTSCFSVETGVGNSPAILLYKKKGFTETKQWNTNHGVRKIRFEKQIQLL